MDKLYNSTDDTKYGTNFVYCYSHCRVHSTGWCTVDCLNKIPLLSETEKDANEEWEAKKISMGITIK